MLSHPFAFKFGTRGAKNKLKQREKMLNKSSIAIMALLGVSQQTRLHAHDENTDATLTVPEVPSAEATLVAQGGSSANAVEATDGSAFW